MTTIEAPERKEEVSGTESTKLQWVAFFITCAVIGALLVFMSLYGFYLIWSEYS